MIPAGLPAPDEEEDVAGPLPAPPPAAPLPPSAADESLLTPDSPIVNQPPPGAAAGLMQPGEAVGQPPGAPGPNVPPPPALLPNGQIDTATENKRLLTEQGQNAADAEAAEKTKGAAEVGVANAESQGADQALKVQQQAQADQAAAIQKANQNTQGWLDNYQQQAAKYQGMGLHDFYSDKSTGDKVLSGLSMLFGAGAQMRPGGVGGTNPGMQIVDNAIERDFRMQTAQIEKQKSNVQTAREGYEMGMSAKQSAVADVNMKKAAALDSAAAQLVSLKMKAGIPLAQATADANVVALRQKANATRLETVQVIHAQNIQDANVAIQQERADAYRAKMTRGKGGGGAGGSSLQAASVQLQKEIQDAADTGKPMSGADIAARGAELHIPQSGKAGHISIDQINAGIAKAGGVKARDNRLLDTETKKWSTDNQLPQLIKKQQELGAVLDEIKSAPHNPLQQALAVEKAVSSARGGAASRQALDLALHHLGGKWDSIESMIQGAKDGQLGQKQMDNFIGFMTNQLGEAQKEGKDKYDEFQKYKASQPAMTRQALEAAQGRMFSGLHGFAEQGGGGAPKLNDKQAATLIRFVSASPNDPRVGAAKERLRASGYPVQ